MTKPVQPRKDITAGEVLAIATSIALRHNMTYVALLDILRSYNYLFGERAVPDTKFMLMKKLFAIETSEITYHVFCPECTKYLDKRENIEGVVQCQCGTNVDSLAPNAYFIELDIAEQLRRLFLNANIVEDLEKGIQRFDGTLRDITDGKVYQNYLQQIKRGQWDLSYTMNTDGCMPDDSSVFSAWPQYIMLHELSPHLRKKHVLLAGLWFQKKEPDMNLFFKPFVKQAKNLHEKGVSWTWKGTERVSFLHPLGCCVDTPARAAVLKMSTFHGYDGCTYCHQRGKRINDVMKWTHVEPASKDRTDAEIRKRMINPDVNIKNNEGVWGLSFLAALNTVDLVDGIPVDLLHTACQGGPKLVTTILTKAPKRNTKKKKLASKLSEGTKSLTKKIATKESNPRKMLNSTKEGKKKMTIMLEILQI